MCVIAVCFSMKDMALQAQIVGQSVPALVLPDRNGQESALADLKGNYVYLHFWASWCPNSITQLPIVTQIYDEYKDSNFKIYSVSLDASRDAWLNAIDVFQLEWPQHQCDFNGPFSHRLDNFDHVITPFGYLISPEGIVLEVDPDVHEYAEWFNMGVAEGNYYTVNIGAFSDLMYVDFDYIEEMGLVESGLNVDGSYYVHVGKYANVSDAENTLKKAIGRGYYEAKLTTDAYSGEASLSYVQPPALSIYDNNVLPAPNFYTPPFNPQPSLSNNNQSGKNTSGVMSNNNSPQTPNKSIFEDQNFSNSKTSSVEPNEPQQFYTPPQNKSIVQKNEFDIQLPDYKKYPQEEQYPNNTPNIYESVKQGEDFLKGPNPFIQNIEGSGNSSSKSYNFDNKWENPQGGLTPLSPPEIIPELFQHDSQQEQPSESDDFYPYSSGFDDYVNIHPSEGVYLEEDNSAINYKESKYEKKLRIKKQKAKRKQEKLKREMQATMKEIEELDESIQITRQYPEY